MFVHRKQHGAFNSLRESNFLIMRVYINDAVRPAEVKSITRLIYNLNLYR